MDSNKPKLVYTKSWGRRRTMKHTVNIGVIGLGSRGSTLIGSPFMIHPDVSIIAVCDVYEDRVSDAAAAVEAETGRRPLETTDFRELLAVDAIDAVLVCTAWESHVHIALAAMEAGKYVGLEVGGAYSVKECWDLIDTYERTKVPVMLMENCCYGRNELMVLNMVEQGVFGEIVHCAGGYHHDLRPEIAFGQENRHYRLRNYANRNCENYPTHELGPIARILGIHHGNRMLTLTSTASKARGLSEYAAQRKPDDQALRQTAFLQGDIVTTVITCANGETIVLTLDTTLPRYYSRGLQVRGTKGMYSEESDSIFLDQEHADMEFGWKGGNAGEYREEYEHPIWQRYIEEGVKEGHDGMDWLVFSDFIRCVQHGTQTSIDVYDTAAWMCISTLSEESIALGGHPVTIPDFTNGAWITNDRRFCS